MQNSAHISLKDICFDGHLHFLMGKNQKCEIIGWRYINNRSDAQRLYISAKKPFSNLFFANGVVTCVVVMKCE